MSSRRGRSANHRRAENFVVSFWYFYICYCLQLSQLNSFGNLSWHWIWLLLCSVPFVTKVIVVLEFWLLYLMKIDFHYFLDYFCPVTCRVQSYSPWECELLFRFGCFIVICFILPITFGFAVCFVHTMFGHLSLTTTPVTVYSSDCRCRKCSQIIGHWTLSHLALNPFVICYNTM